MNGINNTEHDTLHALHRAMAKHRKDQQLYQNEMAIQKIKGLASAALGLLMLRAGGAEYALPALPFLVLGVYLFTTRRNFERGETKGRKGGRR